ncbi:MAG: hypothetical protein JSS81_25605 [Acidobacteria bacterium]|nr:hypothetical protein [Acidobacteriota bacterium]
MTLSLMFSFNFTKIPVVFGLLAILFSGCGFWKKTTDAEPSQNLPVSDDLKSEIPFSTREPERFQAEIVVTTGEIERVTLTARSGANRRYDFNYGTKNQLTSLQADKNYLLLPEKKIYAEATAPPPAAADDWANFLTTEWLSEKSAASFEKLETTGNLTKYRVKPGANETAEILIFVDEKLGLPFKEEFYGGEAGQKTLLYTVELRNFKPEPDDGLFAVPKDFRKVPVDELRRTAAKEESK